MSDLTARQNVALGWGRKIRTGDLTVRRYHRRWYHGGEQGEMDEWQITGPWDALVAEGLVEDSWRPEGRKRVSYANMFQEGPPPPWYSAKWSVLKEKGGVWLLCLNKPPPRWQAIAERLYGRGDLDMVRRAASDAPFQAFLRNCTKGLA